MKKDNTISTSSKKEAMPSRTEWHSWKSGKLCKGCGLCVEGKKLVLFVTGLCAQKCFYCPIGEHKFGKDVVFANEWRIADPENPKELLEEARLTGARGAGITGGDPLMNTERCCEYIRLLKKNFGKDFHIHLYTPLKLVTAEKLSALRSAGLDEIRFHPDLDDDSLWTRLSLARDYGWDVGVEIPALPGYELKTKRLIDFIADKIDFLNLNELEVSDNQAVHYDLKSKGFSPKDSVSYGVKGSENMALRMLAYARKKNAPAHYCTAKLKDSVQVKNRIQARAENVALDFDKITDDGTLVRGSADLRFLQPGAKYRQRKAEIDPSKAMALLEIARHELIGLGMKEDELMIDPEKLRLLMPAESARKNSGLIKKKGMIPCIVEEYPTADAVEVDVKFV